MPMTKTQSQLTVPIDDPVGGLRQRKLALGIDHVDRSGGVALKDGMERAAFKRSRLRASDRGRCSTGSA